MILNTLRLNQDKTEFFLIAKRNVSAALPDLHLSVGALSIRRSTSIKNLGVTIDESLTMTSQVNTICKSVNFHIRNLWRIRRFITIDACHQVVRGLVLSRLDYANCLLNGAREADLTRPQRLQNKAARLVMACGRDVPSIDLLRYLGLLDDPSNFELSGTVSTVGPSTSISASGGNPSGGKAKPKPKKMTNKSSNAGVT
ncbi:uncharacterized protein LOC117301730 [Asterias rubens]|uniref:uncharacterized protein LOC117301730 n=1 Tax=Asterias rubens TaxID=7604 RepID=UPI00145575EE|nr:uncharacterized protein LOC117301730 [Asterias rubens]